MDSLESLLKKRQSNLLGADTVDLRLAIGAHVNEASLVLEASLGEREVGEVHHVTAGINEALEDAVLAQNREEDGEDNGVDGEDDHRLALRRQGDQNTGRENYE